MRRRKGSRGVGRTPGEQCREGERHQNGSQEVEQERRNRETRQADFKRRGGEWHTTKLWHQPIKSRNGSGNGLHLCFFLAWSNQTKGHIPTTRWPSVPSFSAIWACSWAVFPPACQPPSAPLQRTRAPSPQETLWCCGWATATPPSRRWRPSHFWTSIMRPRERTCSRWRCLPPRAPFPAALFRRVA